MGYLNFSLEGSSPSGKTQHWGVNTLSGQRLMRISWYAPWRKYTVDTGGCKTICDSGCLREIADFLDKLNKQHKDSR